MILRSRPASVVLLLTLSACGLSPGREYREAATVAERRPTTTVRLPRDAAARQEIVPTEPPAEVPWPALAPQSVSDPSLSNGARLLVVPRPGVAHAEIAIAVRLDDRRPAVRRAFAYTLLAAAGRSPDGFREVATSGRLSYVATADGVILQIRTLTALLPGTLTHVLPRLFAPKLLAQDYVFAKTVLRQNVQYSRVQKAATDALSAIVLSRTPYAELARHPSADELDALTGDDVMNLRSHLNADDVVVAIVGGEDAPSSLVPARAVLETLPRRAARYTPPAPSAVSSCPAERRVPGEGAHQTTIALGFRTVPASHVDVPSLEVLSATLGPGLASRLNRTVRTRLGATYGVQAVAQSFAHAGLLSIVTSVEPARVSEARAAIDAELDRLRADPLTDAELERARVRAAYEHPRDDLAVRLARDALSGRRPEAVASPEITYARVTADDVRRVAALYLASERRCVVEVTSAPAR